MIEDELRATFARHEVDAPAVGQLRSAIERLWVRRRRRRLATRRGAAVVVVVALAVGVVPTALARVTGGLVSLPGAVLSEEPPAPLNLLLLGHDGRRADTIMVVHLPADRRKAYLISLERDTIVDIPGHGRNKINSAYFFGGASLTASVVTTVTGVAIDGTVTVSLGALKRVMNILGGVPVCVPKAISSYHTKRIFPVGCYTIDGESAIDLVRQRMSLVDGAYGRDRTNQRVLIGLAARVTQLNLLRDADKIVSLTRVPGVTVDFGQIGVVQLAGQLHDIGPEDVVGLSQPSFNPVPADKEHLGERLDPKVAPELFAALQGETLDAFAAAHPDWVLEH